LERAGRERRWGDFLALMPEEPKGIELKCYYLRARRARGDLEQAWEGAGRLWVYGKSRPDVCDPLFAAWMNAGQLNDELVWQRLLLTFDTRQRSLMRYVASLGSADLAPWARRLQQVYASPDVLRQLKLPPEDARSQDIATRGLNYLARYRPEKALDDWQRFQGELVFDADQREAVESAIALRSLHAKSTANRDWLSGALARLKDDHLVELRLRWALEEQDWEGLDRALQLLSPALREAKVWRYWQARVWEQRGLGEEARRAFAELAQERDYYGFLAADRLGVPYRFNLQKHSLTQEQRVTLRSLPSVQRTAELIFQEEPANAHSEWLQLLGQLQDDQSRVLELGSLAAEEGWYRMAIDAAGRVGAWDALDLRFPTPYVDTFSRYARLRQVSNTELMAIARRESSFYPRAHSAVGARGLMQIMPPTGRQVAAGLGVRSSNGALYQVEHNVMLGSAYYRELLDRFGGNRVFALAAYNAGPHRVDRWRHKAGKTLPVDVWTETIPYRETRNYVQRVLEYNTVFQHLLGTGQESLLSPAERSAAY
ncbi:MAG: transglycosylase SLT domain-containing protein, partial [Parahaliea sp.]